MDSTKLVEWLIAEKQMSIRSAKDVLSRYCRICRILGVNSINSTSLDELQANEQFKQSSIFIKSQLKRTVTLCQEFISKSEKR
ncbi:MAG: hypothetical protein IJW19_00760 [Clostridia bacterium]|nr:hypothetical protein [Clostridia bacterium]